MMTSMHSFFFVSQCALQQYTVFPVKIMSLWQQCSSCQVHPTGMVFLFLPVIRVCAFGGLLKLNRNLVNKIDWSLSQPETAVCDNSRIQLETYSYDHFNYYFLREKVFEIEKNCFVFVYVPPFYDKITKMMSVMYFFLIFQLKYCIGVYNFTLSYISLQQQCLSKKCDQFSEIFAYSLGSCVSLVAKIQHKPQESHILLYVWTKDCSISL